MMDRNERRYVRRRVDKAARKIDAELARTGWPAILRADFFRALSELMHEGWSFPDAVDALMNAANALMNATNQRMMTRDRESGVPDFTRLDLDSAIARLGRKSGAL
jgi:hypothetical protein